MVIGILQFELLIHDAESLKDKRRVVRSLKDRLHREHLVSVAEVAAQDRASLAVLGLALVGTDGRFVAQTLDRIVEKLRGMHDAELGDIHREVLQGEAVFSRADRPDDRRSLDELTREMLSNLEGLDLP